VANGLELLLASLLERMTEKYKENGTLNVIPIVVGTGNYYVICFLKTNHNFLENSFRYFF